MELAAKIHAVEPAILALASLTAGRRSLRREAGFGEQKERIGATWLWQLPLRTPVANCNWDETWWRALAKAAQEA